MHVRSIQYALRNVIRAGGSGLDSTEKGYGYGYREGGCYRPSVQATEIPRGKPGHGHGYPQRGSRYWPGHSEMVVTISWSMAWLIAPTNHPTIQLSVHPLIHFPPCPPRRWRGVGKEESGASHRDTSSPSTPPLSCSTVLGPLPLVYQTISILGGFSIPPATLMPAFLGSSARSLCSSPEGTRGVVSFPLAVFGRLGVDHRIRMC
ncbi:hypothetical protein B0I35DRAFT_226651 [Stachybotrys elegans]|uniref:Uncharacterized protein n=1 Tax=Stachybotrys elegans TaxID=80388 RepID=A0A8K0STA6_9HYPO|nr:hypothetical protein B0I35DRAFT_226651 [Stachybotrys elegans]